MKINPARRPIASDGSERYRVVQCDVDCAAAHAGDDALARRCVRNVLRKEPALSYQSQREYFKQ
eukprot:4065471-Pyramimonas_sp.AAC.1